MLQNSQLEKEIHFVAGHYRRHAFVVSDGWRRLGIAGRSWFNTRIAAAVAVGVVLTVSAGIYTWVNYIAVEPQSGAVQPVVDSSPSDIETMPRVVRIEFTDAPLCDVVSEIEEVYGVRIVNAPREEYRLTLSYEGTAEELVETINEILGTKLEIKE